MLAARRPQWPQTSPHRFRALRCSVWPADRLPAASPTCRHVHTVPKTATGSAFALRYILRRRSRKLMGAFIISPLLSVLSEVLQTPGPLRSTDIAPCHRSYGPLRHPLLFGRFPGITGYSAYLTPPLSRWEEEGFSSCLARPCHRAAAPTPPESRIVSAS